MESTCIYMLVSHFRCIARFASLCDELYPEELSCDTWNFFWLIVFPVLAWSAPSYNRWYARNMCICRCISLNREIKSEFIDGFISLNVVNMIKSLKWCHVSCVKRHSVTIFSFSFGPTKMGGPDQIILTRFAFFRVVCWRAMKPLAIATRWKMSDEAIG